MTNNDLPQIIESIEALISQKKDIEVEKLLTEINLR